MKSKGMTFQMKSDITMICVKLVFIIFAVCVLTKQWKEHKRLDMQLQEIKSQDAKLNLK